MKRLDSINNHRPLVKEAILHTCASCFINVSRHFETVKVLSLQPHTFIWFLLSGYPDEVLVFDTLLKLLSLKKGALVYHFFSSQQSRHFYLNNTGRKYVLKVMQS